MRGALIITATPHVRAPITHVCSSYLLRDLRPPEPPVCDGAVDASICLVIKLGDGHSHKVADEAGGHWVAATT
jgi:hypothetical protein